MGITHEHIFFDSEGFKLEGVLSFPKGVPSCPGVVICHPHPAYGGDMNNNVVMGIKKALEPDGFVILRFNFRGVNLSEGRYDEGKGEVNDVFAAVNFLKGQSMVDSKHLFLVGYSFGAWVGLRAVLKVGNLKAVAGISPPLGIYDFDFLTEFSSPVLLISGGQDHICNLKEFENIFNKISSPQKKFIIPKADHFYWRREGEVGEEVRRFFSSYLS